MKEDKLLYTVGNNPATHLIDLVSHIDEHEKSNKSERVIFSEKYKVAVLLIRCISTILHMNADDQIKENYLENCLASFKILMPKYSEIFSDKNQKYNYLINSLCESKFIAFRDNVGPKVLKKSAKEKINIAIKLYEDEYKIFVAPKGTRYRNLLLLMLIVSCKITCPKLESNPKNYISFILDTVGNSDGDFGDFLKLLAGDRVISLWDEICKCEDGQVAFDLYSNIAGKINSRLKRVENATLAQVKSNIFFFLKMNQRHHLGALLFNRKKAAYFEVFKGVMDYWFDYSNRVLTEKEEVKVVKGDKILSMNKYFIQEILLKKSTSDNFADMESWDLGEFLFGYFSKFNKTSLHLKELFFVDMKYDPNVVEQQKNYIVFIGNCFNLGILDADKLLLLHNKAVSAMIKHEIFMEKSYGEVINAHNTLFLEWVPREEITCQHMLKYLQGDGADFKPLLKEIFSEARPAASLFFETFLHAMTRFFERFDPSMPSSVTIEGLSDLVTFVLSMLKGKKKDLNVAKLTLRLKSISQPLQRTEYKSASVCKIGVFGISRAIVQPTNQVQAWQNKEQTTNYDAPPALSLNNDAL